MNQMQIKASYTPAIVHGGAFVVLVQEHNAEVLNIALRFDVHQNTFLPCGIYPSTSTVQIT